MKRIIDIFLIIVLCDMAMEIKTMTIEKLAAMMNVTEADVTGYIACLRMWMSKGYTFEEAIKKHNEQMVRIVNKAAELAQNSTFREMAVDAFYPEK